MITRLSHCSSLSLYLFLVVRLVIITANIKSSLNSTSLSQTQHPFHVLSLPFRPGAIVLGMHRSGTSMLTGLLYRMNLNVGGPLIISEIDNERGHFERVDVVLQNDAILAAQGFKYDSSHLHNFDYLFALKHILNEIDFGLHFFEGRRALRFLNEPRNTPWVLKDPRLCITLRAWLPLLSHSPAVVFMYRYPLAVAQSLMKREPGKYSVAQILQLWYLYNKLAIQQSSDMCRIVCSFKQLMTYPQDTVARISEQLRLCGIDPVRDLNSADLVDFMKDTSFEDFVCTNVGVYELPIDWLVEPGRSVGSDLILYNAVMKLYCALENGSAFNPDYQFDVESIHEYFVDV